METTMTNRLFACLGAVMLPCLAFAADDPPAWVRDAAAQNIPSYSSKVGSVELLREEMVTVDADGRRVMRERAVVKVLQQGSEIHAYRTYDSKSGRIRDFQAWILPPSGKPLVAGKNRILDISMVQDAREITDTRAKVLDFGPNPVNSILAWEITEEEKTIFTQTQFAFQESMPVLTSRFAMTLPSGWEARGVIFNPVSNKDKVEPQTSGTTTTWELRTLPWIEREEYGPKLAALAPRLMVSYYPPADNRAGLQGLKDWAAVSRWLTPLVDPPADVTSAIRAKAQQLTANAHTETEKLRAIAEFVQQTSYVAVELNLTRGGGYTPHRAEDTLTKNAGDCKDKATLMRALLKAAGIESYLTTITADDRTYVRSEWASPTQFNHAIVAARVSEAVTLPSVVPHETLGRLLMFDATDPITPLGDIPEGEQGSYALVIAGVKGALIRMPLFPAADNRIESAVEADMDANGRLNARVQRRYFGQSSVSLRGLEKLRGKEEVKRRFERGWSRRVGALTLNQMSTETQAAENRLTVNLDMGVNSFGQVMQGRMMILRPGLLTSGGDYSFGSKQRSGPIMLEPDLRRDTVRVRIPGGFAPDEVPAPDKIESPYGVFDVTWVVKNGEILLEQTLEVRGMVAPAAEFAQVRDFFDRVAGAQNAPLVLVRQ